MDRNQIPTISFGTTAVFVVLIVLIVINLNLGVNLTTDQLTQVHNYTIRTVVPIESERTIYNIVTVLTLGVGLWALVVDFILITARQQGLQPDRLCHGVTNVITVRYAIRAS